MSDVKQLREDIELIYRQIHFLALQMAAAREPDAIEILQAKSMELHSKLRESEGLLSAALKKARQERQNEVSPERAGGSLRDGEPVFRGSPRDERMNDAAPLGVRVEPRMPNVPTSVVHLLARRPDPLLSVTIKNPGRESRRVKVTSYVEGFSAKAVTTREISRGSTATIDQFPAFLPDRVRLVNELTTAALHVEVAEMDGKLVHHESSPISLLARTTWVLQARDPTTGDDVEFMDLLAAWVTPHTPEIHDVLRRAADASNFKAMLGYQTDAAGVREHVRAIFETLKADGIVYINSPIAFGNSEFQYLQRLRLPRESLASRSANCIDGALLMASVLEAAAIEPAIVLIPGHAYLAWSPRGSEPGAPDVWEYLETTLISKGTFDEACDVAARRTERLLKASQADPAKTFVTIVPIAKLRAAGITPME